MLCIATTDEMSACPPGLRAQHNSLSSLLVLTKVWPEVVAAPGSASAAPSQQSWAARDLAIGSQLEPAHTCLTGELPFVYFFVHTFLVRGPAEIAQQPVLHVLYAGSAGLS